MQNAAGETCGGSLLNAFATSCDTVFAPVGAEVGAKRLVSMAKRFGFDEPTGIPSAIESTIPSAGTIGDSVAVGLLGDRPGPGSGQHLGAGRHRRNDRRWGQATAPEDRAKEKPRYVRVTTAKVAERCSR